MARSSEEKYEKGESKYVISSSRSKSYLPLLKKVESWANHRWSGRGRTMAHLVPIKAACAILEPLLFLNEIHSCVNMSEQEQEKHSFSLAHALRICWNAGSGPSCPIGGVLLVSIRNYQRWSFLIVSALRDETKNKNNFVFRSIRNNNLIQRAFHPQSLNTF